MTAEDLRKSILQQAIQGKLVPQDPKDEPASELLSKIRAEKERLIKEKKIKRDKNETIIYRGEDNSYYEKILATGEIKCIDDEIPFEIPDSWEWARGNSIFKPMESQKPTCDFTYIDIDAINNRRNIIENPKFVLAENAPSRASRKLHSGDIVFSMVRPYLKNIALITDDYRNAIASTGFYVISPEIGLDSLFMFVLMLSPYVIDGLNKFMKGDNSPSINNSHIETFLYPIPPQNEQKRIAKLYFQLNPKIDVYEKSQIQLHFLNCVILNRLKKSILADAIQGNLVPQIAKEEPASKLLEKIQQTKLQLVKGGKLKKKDLVSSIIYRGDDNKYYEKVGTKVSEITDEIPYELPTNWEFVRLSSICWLVDGEKNSGEKLPYMDAKYHRGKDTTFITSGKVVNPPCKVILVDGENSGEIFNVTERGYLGSTFKVLQMSTLIDEEWLHLLLNSYRELFKGSKVGAAIPHLNKTLFRNLIVGLPSYSEQNRITKAVKRILSIIESH